MSSCQNLQNGDTYGHIRQQINSNFDLLEQRINNADLDGCQWLNGETDPVDTSGTDNDFYLNTLSGDIFKKASGTWSLIGNIKGPAGEQGPKGADGTMTFEDLTDEQKESLKGDKGIQGEKGEKGERGEKGDTGETGPVGPKGDTGETGVGITSASINDSGVLVLVYSNGQSEEVGNVKGADGTSINILGNFSSSDELPNTNQNKGDSYLINGKLWVYTESTEPDAVNGFIDAGNIQGPAGRGIMNTLLVDGVLKVVYYDSTEEEVGNIMGPQGPQGEKGDKGEQGEQGVAGANGVDGITYTPEIGTVNTVESSASASITLEIRPDESRVIYNFDLPRGLDGTNGNDGQDGNDGVSPTVEVIETDTGHTVKITDKDGVKSFDVNNGVNGVNGADGANGVDGQDGADGFSPVVTVEPTTDGHTVKVEDVNGLKQFEVLNGKDGVQIDDVNDPSETSVWSSKKTSDEIAKVETELKLINLGENADADNCRIAYENINRVYGYCGFFTQNVPMKGYAVIRCYHYGSGIRQFIDYTASTARTYTRFIPYNGKNPTAWKELATMDKLGGLTFSASGTTLSITNGTNTWTLKANS